MPTIVHPKLSALSHPPHPSQVLPAWATWTGRVWQVHTHPCPHCGGSHVYNGGRVADVIDADGWHIAHCRYAHYYVQVTEVR